MISDEGMVVGSDDGASFWELRGEVEDGTIIVDFSPKGGPSSLQGRVTSSGITWPDGNKWSRVGGKQSPSPGSICVDGTPKVAGKTCDFYKKPLRNGKIVCDYIKSSSRRR